MKNYISYALYGQGAKYLVGACRNAEQCRIFYPDFTPAFWYCPYTVPDNWVAELRKNGAVVWSLPHNSLHHFPKLARFLTADRQDAGVVLVRDTDSRFSARETELVRAWLASDKRFHIIRDYAAHDKIIMGGTWGVKGRLPIASRALIWANEHFDTSRDYDQEFLSEVVWPMVKDSVLQHDSCLRHKYSGSVPFPIPDDPAGAFVGEVMDENDQPNPLCRRARLLGKRAEELL